MKVALVTGNCPLGACGVGDYTNRLASELRSGGVQAEVVSEGRWGLTHTKDVDAGLRTLAPDILHFQYPTIGFGYRLGPQVFALRRSCVITLHEVSQAHILRKLSLYPFTVRPQHLIFTTAHEREFAKKWAPWITRVSSVIPVGSNIDVFPTSAKRQSGEVAYFGLIMPRKGLEEILQLGKLLQFRSSGLKIRIIGKANAKHETYAAKLRFQSNDLPIVWDDGLSHDQVARQLAQCSVAYLPFPDGASERRTSLNAMLANGVAVVTTRGPHTPEGLEGVVKFSSSPEEAYEAIRFLVENAAEGEKLRQMAIAYMQQFSWDRIADQHLCVYERILGSRISNVALSEEGARSASLLRQ
jgi:glycosyltransferase involved in cell wall biosynthesis